VLLKKFKSFGFAPKLFLYPRTAMFEGGAKKENQLLTKPRQNRNIGISK